MGDCCPALSVQQLYCLATMQRNLVDTTQSVSEVRMMLLAGCGAAQTSAICVSCRQHGLGTIHTTLVQDVLHSMNLLIMEPDSMAMHGLLPNDALGPGQLSGCTGGLGVRAGVWYPHAARQHALSCCACQRQARGRIGSSQCAGYV